MPIRHRLDRIEQALRQRDRQLTDAATLAGQAALVRRIEEYGTWFDFGLDYDHAPSHNTPDQLPERRAMARRAIELYEQFGARAASPADSDSDISPDEGDNTFSEMDGP